MYFKRIEMHGFKSFAEPVTIEFDKGLTCIVGPNGSGKSNISDAIRWVLGEQSPRMLRGGKMEEVIFSGTDSRKSRGMAEVTLVIDNAGGSLPIDYKEVALTRRMFRSGESEYLINGNQCRLRDIRDLIMDTGIGVDGYSIIGQGKISDILSSKADSRREIFEEAAGIVNYRTKKAEAERKLESTDANMERVSDIIGEIEGRIDGLREESAKAREYIELRDRHKELEINITLKNIESVELKNEYLSDDLKELEIELKKHEERERELDGSLSDYDERSRGLESSAAEMRERLMEVIEELNESVSRSRLDSERLTSIAGREERLAEEIASAEEKREKERELGRGYDEKRGEVDRRLAAAAEELRNRTASYDAASAELEALEEEADRYRNDIFEISGAINSGKAEISSLQRLQETLEKRKEILLAEKSSGEDSNKETLDRLNRIRAERDQSAADMESVRERLTERKGRLNEAYDRQRRLRSETEELRISAERLSSRMKTIEEMENNYEGYNYAVKHVMKAGLRGISGVVADLISVPKGYETAVETALGASMQNIVCDDDDSAKAAIRSLKESRAGRLTFLPVSSVKGRAVRDGGLEGEKGFVGFGPDCVECDKRYENIVDYLLGRVVIVKDMDDALRISKRVTGFRIVTLDGDVINAGGAITGGRYKNRTANIFGRKAEIEELKRGISSAEADRRDREQKLSDVSAEIEELSSAADALEKELAEAGARLAAAENEMKLTEAMLSDIRSGSDKLRHELENIEKEKENSEKMIREISKKAEADHIAVKEAERISEERRAMCDRRRAELEKLNESVTEAHVALKGLEGERDHIAAMAGRSKESIADMDRDISAKKQELSELKAEREAIIAGSGATADDVRRKEDEKEHLQSGLAGAEEEKERLAKEASALRAEREEVNGMLTRLRDQSYELKIKKAKNETQLDTYKNKLWEDFSVSYVQAMDLRAKDFVMSLAVKENRQIKNRLGELGEVNVGAIEEYETVKERYEFLVSQREDIKEAADGLNKLINEMDRTIKAKFRESFDRIVENFEKKFRELFGGGHAELRLSDENDPLSSDIDIIAQPPGKRLQNINLLSGGEKTLTAIALMFAVLEAKPTPFCILDEVEAALDDANIDRFIDCLREFSGIQFALVTHQKATMEHADVLYGITMPEKGVSKVLSLDMGDSFEM